jgi:hypothetical protein
MQLTTVPRCVSKPSSNIGKANENSWQAGDIGLGWAFVEGIVRPIDGWLSLPLFIGESYAL